MTDPERHGQSHGEETEQRHGEKLIGSARQRVQEVFDAAERAAATIVEEAEEQARHEVDEARREADQVTLERVRLMASLTEGLLEKADTIRRQSDVLVEALDSAIATLERSSVPEEQPKPPSRQGSVDRPAGPDRAATGEPEPVAAAEGAAEPNVESVQPPEAPQAEPEAESRPEKGINRGESASPQRADPLEALRERIATSMRSRTAAAVSRPEPESPPGPPAAVVPERRGGDGVSDGARLLATQMAVAGSSRDEIEARLREDFGIDDAGAILDGVVEA